MEIDNAMRRQALSIPELLEQQYADLEPKTRTVCTFEEIFSFQNIVIVGCGDSRFAGMAVKRTFEKLTGMRTEVMSAIDFSRFYPAGKLGTAPNNPLVIIVSKSGTVARISESAQRARKHGAFVLGVTGNPESPLGLNSSRILKLDIPKFESAPGVRSYLVSLAALTLFAIRLGEVRGKYASVVNTEEFMHLNCFMRKVDKIGTVLICGSESPALSRAKEVAEVIVNDLKRPSLIITDKEGVFDVPADNLIVVPKPVYEINSPISVFLPVAFLMADIMALTGEESGRGLKDNWVFCQNAAGLKNSEIVIM